LCSSYNPAPETWDGLDWSAFARRYFRALFQRVAPPCILLLDNYHRLPVAAPLLALKVSGGL